MLTTNIQATLNIDFKFGKLHSGKIMQVTVTDQNQRYTVIPDNQNCGRFQCCTTLPGSVTINFFGKDMMTDTKIDAAGKIIEDLYVQIQKISIDTFNMGPHFLNNELILCTENNTNIPTSYIGFNGHMILDLNQPSVFKQVMYWKT